MAHSTSNVVGLAAVVLVGIGAGNIVRAQDEDLARQFGEQSAALVSAPPQPDTSPETRNLRNEQEKIWLFGANGGRSLLGDGKRADVEITLTQPFDADVLEPEDFSYGSRTIYETPPTEVLEPRNFQIGKFFKLKAQPTGGLGGRVTLTFPFSVGD